MSNNKDILSQATDALANRPIPSGPSPEVTDATIRRLNEAADSPEPANWKVTVLERIIIMSKYGKYAAAAVVIIAALLAVTFFEKSTPQLWAISDTIKAMRDVRTVHIFARSWDGHKLEMWMLLDPRTGSPTHIRNDMYVNHNGEDVLLVTDISRPDTSYQYHRGGNRVLVSSGSLYNFSGLSFSNIVEQFAQALEAPMRGEFQEGYAVLMEVRRDEDSNEPILIITPQEGFGSWQMIVDLNTKLIKELHDLGEERAGNFIKDFDEIYYDEPLPEGIFEPDLKDDTKIVDHDERMRLVNSPEYGRPTNGLSREQAAEQIVSQYWLALAEQDWQTLGEISPLTTIDSPDEAIEKMNKAWGGVPVELVRTEPLYEEGGCGIGPIKPCIVRISDGTVRRIKIIVRFRNIDGVESCVIAGFYDQAQIVEE